MSSVSKSTLGTPSAITESAAFQMLLTLSKPILSDADTEFLRSSLSANGIDWDSMLDLADWHGCAPCIARHLAPYNQTLPGAVVQRLHRIAVDTSRTNLVLTTELLRVSAHLNSLGIHHLAYKGPVLAQQLYGDIAARPTGDLDLVISPNQIVASRNALMRLGYKDKNGLDEAQQSASFRYGFEHSFCREDGLTVDLHWRVAPHFTSPSLDTAVMWQRASTVRLFNHDIATFGPEDLLVVLCLHAGQHEWAHIGAFTDIAQLLSVNQCMDWEIVCSHLADTHTLRTIAVALLLVQRHCGLELPPKVLELTAQDAQAAFIAEHVRTVLWPRCDFPASLRWALERSRGERWQDRLRFLRMFLNPQMADFTSFRVPSSLIGIYPMLRILRLAYKYGTRR